MWLPAIGGYLVRVMGSCFFATLTPSVNGFAELTATLVN